MDLKENKNIKKKKTHQKTSKVSDIYSETPWIVKKTKTCEHHLESTSFLIGIKKYDV